MELKFKTLIFGNHYVNVQLLQKGIYESNVPFLYSYHETIDNLINQAKKHQLDINSSFNKYIPNIKLCKFIDIYILIDAANTPAVGKKEKCKRCESEEVISHPIRYDCIECGATWEKECSHYIKQL